MKKELLMILTKYFLRTKTKSKMIINTELPKDLDERPLKEQEKILAQIYMAIGKAEKEVFDKLAVVRGKLSTKK